MRQGCDHHTLTGDGIRHHRCGRMAHRDARQRLCHWHSDRCYRDCNRGHGNRWSHTLDDSLSEGGRDGVGVQMRCSRVRRIGWRGGRGTGRGHQILLRDGTGLQTSAAQSGVRLGDAMVVGADRTNRGHQTLLRRSRGGGQRHHFSLASELSVLLQEHLVGGYEIGHLEKNRRDVSFENLTSHKRHVGCCYSCPKLKNDSVTDLKTKYNLERICMFCLQDL